MINFRGNKEQLFTSQLGIPGTDYRIQLGLINGKWASRLLKGTDVVDSYVYKDEDLGESGFPNQNLIVGWVIRTVAIPNINPHQIMKTVQALVKQALEIKYQQKMVAPLSETKNIELTSVLDNTLKRPNTIGWVKEERFESVLGLEGKKRQAFKEKTMLVKEDKKINEKNYPSNKLWILDILKTEQLTSKQLSKRTGLSSQDTRTYLLRLKNEDKVEIVDKKGRYNVYRYKPEKAKTYVQDGIDFLLEYGNYESKLKQGIEVRDIKQLESKFASIDDLLKEVSHDNILREKDKENVDNLEILKDFAKTELEIIKSLSEKLLQTLKTSSQDSEDFKQLMERMKEYVFFLEQTGRDEISKTLLAEITDYLEKGHVKKLKKAIPKKEKKK